MINWAIELTRTLLLSRKKIYFSLQSSHKLHHLHSYISLLCPIFIDAIAELINFIH